MEAMTPEQQKFYNIKKYTDYKVAGDDVDYAVIVDQEKKEVVLQFEESDSKRDWINNFLFIPWSLKLGQETVWTTLGYARAYKSTDERPLRDFINAVLNSPKAYKAAIRGWSFGSAMAKIAARRLEQCGSFVDELTTYGDVKCWLNPFYKAKAERVREYTTPNDAVTWCVPFFFRDRKCKVGPRFSIKEVLHSKEYHCNYEEYDYSKWEEA